MKITKTKIGSDGYIVKFSPKENITAFELARLLFFISIISQNQGHFSKERFNSEFPKIKDLEHHFEIQDLDAL